MTQQTQIEPLELKRRWLDSHGGRKFTDIQEDIIGEYVVMANGRGGACRVYIPPLKEMKEYLITYNKNYARRHTRKG